MKDDTDRLAFPAPSKNNGKALRELLGPAPMIADNKNEIIEIDIDLIDDLFSFEHPFAKSLKRRKGIEELADQIRQCGILQPTILRKCTNGRYEILAGHRRRLAASIAGLTEVPAILKECDDDTAKLIVTYTNLGQRDEILPSEKAKAYKMALDAIKRVAGRPKNNCTPVEHNFDEEGEENGTPLEYHFDKGKKSINIVAEKGGDAPEQVRRYIRLNELIESLLDRVDDKEIPLRAAVEISYLRQQEQKVLDLILTQNQVMKLSIETAKELRAASEEMELTYPIMEAVINPPIERRKDSKIMIKAQKPVYKEVFKGLEKQFKKFSPDKAERLARVNNDDLEKVIMNAVDQYINSL